ncbi:Alpha-N-acetylgalactosamine-specific lectin [Holothuria leucospilota]|uniref:Alpha-N-acetylgalactosamine-specific lectin n=1 Tax=Holothuria leucospilota TaxID=206669 RepID=A0A9Q0YBI8_HOLLE|nr:Alpha-N-acetylgalactosamine-specific lectin [Holothuria leucospilota]
MSPASVALVTLFSLSTQLSLVNGCQDFWTSFGGHCYRYVGKHVRWTEAEAICTGFGDAHLVSIHSQEEFDFVYDLWKESRDDVANTQFVHQGLWTGLTDKDSEGTFKYTDGSAKDYDAFAHGEPSDRKGDQDYVHIWDRPGYEPFWNDAQNWHKFQVMCKQSCLPYLISM